MKVFCAEPLKTFRQQFSHARIKKGEMTTAWWYMRKQKFTGNQQLLVAWRRQKGRSTSAAKIDCCTDAIGFGAVLPNWKIVIKEVPLIPVLLPKKLDSCTAGKEISLNRGSLTTSSTGHTTYLKAQHLLGSDWVLLRPQWKQ